MTRLVTFLHRRPRTRRERLLLRLQSAPDGARKRWEVFRHHRRHRAAHARVEALLLQLGRNPDHSSARPVGLARHRRLHLQHPRR